MVWLETGDSETGSIHILKRHPEFFNKGYIDTTQNPSEQLQVVIERTVRNGESISIKNDRGGTAYVYELTDDDYVTVIVGDNGYIITARPGKFNQ